MKLLCVAAVALAACAPPRRTVPSSAPHPANNAVQPLPLGPASVVVVLASEVPTAIAAGPFVVTAINPGTDLYLSLAARVCDEPALVWFGYSGGGVAVGAGQLLCARSVRSDPHAHAFSGRNEARPTGP